MGKTRVHDGNHVPRYCFLIDQLINETEQIARRLFLNGHFEICEPKNERDHGVATIQASTES